MRHKLLKNKYWCINGLQLQSVSEPFVLLVASMQLVRVQGQVGNHAVVTFHFTWLQCYQSLNPIYVFNSVLEYRNENITPSFLLFIV